VIDPVAWGNPLWDQSVQTFATAAARTSAFPAPLQGAVTWLEDVKRLQVWNGTAWVGLTGGDSYVKSGKFAGNTNAGGLVLIPHGMPGTPPFAVVSMGQGNSGAVYQVAQPAVTNQDGTNIAVTVYRSDTGAGLASTAVIINWVATLA
jgi:hypothetical protein